LEIFDQRKTRFVIVPRSLVTDQGVTYRDKAVYMALCLYANNTTKQARPSTQTIADVVGCSRRSIFESLKRLEDCGYVLRKARRARNGNQLANAYYLLDK